VLAQQDSCDPDMIGFEMVTGYVYSSPKDLLDSIPGTLMLTDCLEACQSNEQCKAVNYETGLCVLFGSTADQHPGMSIYLWTSWAKLLFLWTLN
jgi:hypothetical protein